MAFGEVLLLTLNSENIFITSKIKFMQLVKSIEHVTPDLGEDIKDFQDDLLGYCETEGKHNALKNQPNTVDELQAFIKNHIEINTQEQIHQNQQRFLPICGMVIAKKIQSESDQQCKELTGVLNDYEHKIKAAEKLKKELTPDLNQRKKRKLSHLVVILIGIAEGYLIYEALRRSGFPTIPAFFTALGMAVGIAFLTHVVAEYIQRSQNKRQLIIRTCIVLIPAFIFFSLIGHLRADAYNTIAQLKQQTGGALLAEPGKSSGWKIGIVSFLLYCIGLAISVRYAKTKEEKEQEKAYDKVYREFDELQTKINATNASIETVRAETAQKVQTALATYEYALAREKQLESIANKSLETYASSNLRHRTDGQCPGFFSSPPPFSFTTFFNTSKLN